MKKVRQLFIAGSVVLAMGLAVAGDCFAESGTLNLTFTNWTVPPSPPGRATGQWIEMVEKRTNGKVKVKPFYSSTLLSGKNTIEGVLRGVADIGMSLASYRPERFPMLSLLQYPHEYKHTMVPIKIAWDMYNKFKPEEFKGVKILSFSSNGMGENACGFYGKFPITSAADVEGKEIRVTGTGVPAIELLNGAPVFMTTEEVYEALQKNIISGIYTTFEIIKPFKYAEVIDYITPFPAPAAIMFTIVKQETFDSWPEDVKKVVEDMKMEHSEWAGNFSHKAALGGLDHAVKQGVKQTTISPAERAKMLEMLKPLMDNWLKENTAKGYPAQEWLDEFKKLLVKYNAQY